MSCQTSSISEKLHDSITLDRKTPSNYRMLANNIIPADTIIYTGEPFLIYKGSNELSHMDNSHKLRKLIYEDPSIKSEHLAPLEELYPRTVQDILNDQYLLSVTSIDQLDKLKNMDHKEFTKHMFLAKVAMNQYGDAMNSKLYKSISFFNHSCVPNCLVISDPELGNGIYISTARTINPGEELTINYNPSYVYDDSKKRQAHILANQHFDCACMACCYQKEFPTLVDYRNQSNIIQMVDRHKHCYYCGINKSKLLKCAGCKLVNYCDKECQKLHWKMIHGKYCKIFSQEMITK